MSRFKHQTLGSQVRQAVNIAQVVLNGNPDSSKDWQVIARELRNAADKARKIATLAKRMEAGPLTDINTAEVDAAFES